MELRGIYVEQIAAPVDNPFLTEKAQEALREYIGRQIDTMVDRAILCGAPRAVMVVNGKRYGQVIDLSHANF